MTLYPTTAPTPTWVVPQPPSEAIAEARAQGYAEGMEAAARWHDSEAERLRSTSTEVAAYIALMRAVHMESAAAIRAAAANAIRQSKEP